MRQVSTKSAIQSGIIDVHIIRGGEFCFEECKHPNINSLIMRELSSTKREILIAVMARMKIDVMIVYFQLWLL